MASSGFEVIDSIPDDYDDEVTVSFVGDTVMLGLPEGCSAVAFSAEGRDRFAKAWAEAERRAEAHGKVRPCCDHCNNGEGDPAGHDYTLNGPHVGPCEECAAEKARREHDEGTG